MFSSLEKKEKIETTDIWSIQRQINLHPKPIKRIEYTIKKLETF